MNCVSFHRWNGSTVKMESFPRLAEMVVHQFCETIKNSLSNAEIPEPKGLTIFHPSALSFRLEDCFARYSNYSQLNYICSDYVQW